MNIEELTEEEMLTVIQGDSDEFIPVTEEEMYDGGRWSNGFSQVFRHTSGRFFEFWWDRGATEYQDEGPENLGYCEVAPVKVEVTQYKRLTSFTVVLKNSMYGYEWGPKDFQVNAINAEEAEKKALELSNDMYADVVEVK